VNRPALAALTICGLAASVIWATVPALSPLRGLPLLDYLPRYFAVFALYLGAIVILFRLHTYTPTPASRLPLLALIWLFALLFRLPLLTRPPTLSDDVYRYIWDGRVQNAGVNPYAYRVDSPALDHLATPSRVRVNNPQMASPYLPVAQIAFAAVYRLAPESPAAFQIAAAAFDLLTSLLVMLILRQRGQPLTWVLIYLWNPLVVVEFAHGAHVDALMTMLMMAALAADGRYPKAGPVILGLATLVKPVPIFLLPALLPHWGSKRAAIFVGTVILGLFPYVGAGLGLTADVGAGTGIVGAARIYLEYWNFNGGLYHWLEVWIAGYRTEGAVPHGTPGVQMARALCGLALLLALGVVFCRAWKLRAPQPLRDGALHAIRESRLWVISLGAYFLLAPTFNPWYLAPVIALLPLCAAASPQVTGDWSVVTGHWLLFTLPWLYLSASVALSYLTYLDPLNLRETEFVRRWEYLPLYALLALAALWPRRIAAPSARR
jgi:hypothetical protein